ncbi:type 1 fimbrial protein [Acinetobacter haemolyticus]|uniref:type 1 fimbrial protein n=1 Tax=Acinetobacter haemolyticus TaxID=29430 RepID=UPI0021D06825|nr:type 1 fimbrial protein [Acinetobacter haemolyticus]MCU4388700.1 type 1 fimbrial protein [Acinetobacter haemolyticus]
MNKIIYKFILSASLAIIASTSYAANTIKITGQIVEDTCSQQHQHQDCELINNLNKKINHESTNLNDLASNSQKNNMIEINIERRPENNNSVIIISYY